MSLETRVLLLEQSMSLAFQGLQKLQQFSDSMTQGYVQLNTALQQQIAKVALLEDRVITLESREDVEEGMPA